jgi:UDP-glucose 4-epimerase
MTDATVLVTGGAGFLGSHVAEELVRLGCRVVVLDDLSGGFRENVPEGCEFVRGSIEDSVLVRGLFEEHSFSHVYHLAAYAAEGLSHYIRRHNYACNVVGSMCIINECIRSGVKCLVFTSSIAVYGEEQAPYAEEDLPRPIDPYGIGKYAVEMDLRSAFDVFGLNSVVFRPHNIYGERQNIWDPYRNVVGIFIRKAINNELLPVFGDGEQTRAFSYVRDVAVPIARSGFNEVCYNQCFNIGADEQFTINELIAAISLIFGRRLEKMSLDARPEVKHAFSDHHKARHYFQGLASPTSLQVGLENMVRWALAAQPRQPKRFENIEVARGLPAAWQ